MVEQAKQYILVERPDSRGEIKEIWRGGSPEFARRWRYLKTANVFAVIEEAGVPVRKIPLNVSRSFLQCQNLP